MRYQTHQTAPLCVLSLAILGAMVLWQLYVFRTDSWAQMSTSDTSSAVRQDSPDNEDLASLTEAQQKARQLATTLIGRQDSSLSAPNRTPLEVLADQALRRSVLLFTSTHLEGRLTGGRWTFSSPVDNAASTDEKDARRPLFIPASEEAFMVLELITK